MSEARTVEGASVDVLSVGGGFVNLTIPAAMGAFVAGIAVGERWIFAGTSAGAVSASHEIQADESHPAITDQATVNKLTPTRRLVTASEIYAAAGYTTGVELRSAVREEVQASASFGVATYAVAVSHRTPAISEVQASHTYGASSSTVAVNKYLSTRHVVEASGTLGLLTSTATVLSTTPARREVQASEIYPAALPTVGVEVRKPARREITAEGHHDPPDVTTTALFKRAADRR